MYHLPGMDIKLKIGHRIKELRKDLELSQESLAYKAEVDRTYVTDVENGRRNVSVEILERLIKALEVSFAVFFNSKEFKK
jgi:transcriptional regulator with XRE-family HTH domain